MKCFPVRLLGFFTIIALCAQAQSAEYELSDAGGPPDGLPAEVKTTLAAEGYRITSGDGTMCEIWLVKSPAVKKGFTPGFRVKYPFEAGTLVGVLRVGEGEEFADFRDQVILPGLYTLRYGQQPQDGNHIGTSQQADFLLAVPVGEDKAAGTIEDQNELNDLSAVAAGSAHPAIFSLLPSEGEAPEKPTLSHQDGRDFWVLQTTGNDKRPPLRLVVVGFGEQ